MKLITSLTLTITLLLSGTGCIKTHASLTPSQNAIYTLNQSLAALAVANQGAAKVVIGVQSAGLINVGLANDILTWNREVGVGVIAAVTVMQSQAPVDQKIIAVKNALIGLPLPPTVTSFLNGAQTNQTVIGLIESLKSIVQLIVVVESQVGVPNPTAATVGGVK